ncbi:MULTISPECIES: hypothetical protein [unclassified Pseudomonas]|nr:MULTISPECIES: hypothetical protein [unclassified Pseudomonas]
MNRHFSAKALTSQCLAGATATATDSVAEAGRRIARACAQLRGTA